MSNPISRKGPRLLWWGRGDAHYSRNSLILTLLKDLGWHVDVFYPASSHLGAVQAFFSRLKRPDLIWVPCFRHQDIQPASLWARRWSVPLVVDPLISAYEKAVFERCKWPAQSRRAERFRRWEEGTLARADLVVADTPAHADFFCKELSVPANRIKVIYVGAESHLFRSGTAASCPTPPYEVLFYGSFLELQGVETIVEAARLVDDQQIHWVLLGDGDLRRDIEGRASGQSNIFFEPWIDYQQLPSRLVRAHILLGVFGTTPKANLVIPNKVFQAMAMAKPIITRRADAYPREVAASETIGWVGAGDPEGLAEMVKQWLAKPEALASRGKRVRELFEGCFGEEVLRRSLEKVLSAVQSPIT